MSQRGWLELIKDYELEVHYNPGQANIVADVLSHKAHATICQMYVLLEKSPSLEYYSTCRCTTLPSHSYCGKRSLSRKRMMKARHIKRRMEEGYPNVNCFHEDVEGTLWFTDRLIVPKKETLMKKILDEAHTLRYSIHPSSTKMYHNLREQFWWTRMKRETALYVSECDTC
jgi:hypothetical protein